MSDDGNELDLDAIEKDLIAHELIHSREADYCCAPDQCNDVRLLIAEVKRLRVALGVE